MDAITLLKADHKTVETLFKRFEDSGRDAFVEKRSLVDRIIMELSVHAVIEEQVLYPAIRNEVPGAEDMTLEALEEHHIVKWTLSELDTLPAEDERFTAKVTVLIESVRHHVEEEENDLFPKVRDALGRTRLGQIGEALETAKKLAPTHPHPRSPDTPPGNMLVGAAATIVDKVRDVVGAGADRNPAPRPRATKAVARKTSTSATSSSTGTARKATGGARKARPTAKKAAGTAKKATPTARKATGTAKKATSAAKKVTTSTTKKATGTARKATTAAKRSTRPATKSVERATRSATKAGSAGKATATRKASSAAKKAGATARKATNATKTGARAGASAARNSARQTAR